MKLNFYTRRHLHRLRCAWSCSAARVWDRRADTRSVADSCAAAGRDYCDYNSWTRAWAAAEAVAPRSPSTSCDASRNDVRRPSYYCSGSHCCCSYCRRCCTRSCCVAFGFWRRSKTQCAVKAAVEMLPRYSPSELLWISKITLIVDVIALAHAIPVGLAGLLLLVRVVGEQA